MPGNSERTKLTGLCAVGVLVIALGAPVALLAQAKKSRTLVEGGGGSTSVRAKDSERLVSVERYVKLAPLREWTDREGKVIHAELLSWPINDPAAAEKPVEELRFSTVREGKIRLRKGGKIFVIALARFSDEDRKFISGLHRYHEGRFKKPAEKNAGESATADRSDGTVTTKP